MICDFQSSFESLKRLAESNLKKKNEKRNFLTGSAVVGLALRFLFINHLFFRLKKSRCKQDLLAPLCSLEARGARDESGRMAQRSTTDRPAIYRGIRYAAYDARHSVYGISDTTRLIVSVFNLLYLKGSSYGLQMTSVCPSIGLYV